MNDRLQDLINGLADHSALLDSLMRFSANDLVFLLAAIPPILWFWPAPAQQRSRNQRLAALAVLSVLIAVVGARLLGALYSESRPFVSDPDTRLLIHHDADNGFPSDHVAFAAAIAGVLLFSLPQLGLPALLGVLAIGVSRVFVGVHWPLDVVAAFGLGVATGALVLQAEPLLVGPQRAFSRLLPPLLLSPPSP